MKKFEVQVDRDVLRYEAYPVPCPRLSDLSLVKATEVELVFCNYDGYRLLLRDGKRNPFSGEQGDRAV